MKTLSLCAARINSAVSCLRVAASILIRYGRTIKDNFCWAIRPIQGPPSMWVTTTISIAADSIHFRANLSQAFAAMAVLFLSRCLTCFARVFELLDCFRNGFAQKVDKRIEKPPVIDGNLNDA